MSGGRGIDVKLRSGRDEPLGARGGREECRTREKTGIMSYQSVDLPDTGDHKDESENHDGHGLLLRATQSR